MSKVEAVQIRPGNLLEWDKRIGASSSPTTSTSAPRRRLHAGRDEGHRGRHKTNSASARRTRSTRVRRPARHGVSLPDATATSSWTRKTTNSCRCRPISSRQSGYLLPNTTCRSTLQRPAIGVDIPPSVVLTWSTRARHQERHRHQYFQAGEDGDRDHGQVPPFINKARRSRSIQRGHLYGEGLKRVA